MKATSLFGGVQVFNILISIIRTKFVAVLLGASGLGMMGLFQSAISLVSTITGLGLSSSAIREISVANNSGDNEKISRVVAVFRKWIIATGLIGCLITILISPILSDLSFGSKEQTWSFVALSVTVLFAALSNSQNTILRGFRKNKEIGLTNVLGSSIGLIFTIPLYYYYSLKGIVPSLILSSLVTLLLSTFFVKKVKISKISIPLVEVIKEGNVMVKFGIVMTISGFFSTASTYILSIFISNQGGIQDLGLYQAGVAITMKYVGLVFTAMAMDYYPRLSAVNKDEKLISNAVNQQAEVGMLILTPIVLLLISTMPLVIKILYSAAFLPAVDLVQWLALGILLKLISWSLGFIVLAKSDSRIFFITELSGNIIMLGLNLIFYSYYGLVGLGMSYGIGYFLYLVMMIQVCKKKYNFRFSQSFLSNATICFFTAVLAFMSAKILSYPFAYLSGSILFIISMSFSFFILNKRMDLMLLFTKKIKK